MWQKIGSKVWRNVLGIISVHQFFMIHQNKSVVWVCAVGGFRRLFSDSMHDTMYASLSPFYSIARSVQRISYACMHILNAKLTCHKHDNMLNLLFLQVSMINCFDLLRLKVSSYLVHHIMCNDCLIRIENILVFLSYISIASLIVKLFLLICFKTAIIIGKKNTTKYKTHKSVI